MFFFCDDQQKQEVSEAKRKVVAQLGDDGANDEVRAAEEARDYYITEIYACHHTDYFVYIFICYFEWINLKNKFSSQLEYCSKK